jgi:hypothetical protein
MGVFDIEDNVVLTPKQLIGMGFERLTKNTWELHTTQSGANNMKWWSMPVTITYDTKRKMFRRDKKRYFVKDRGDFEMVFTSIVADTNYNNPIKIKSHFQRGNIV